MATDPGGLPSRASRIAAADVRVRATRRARQKAEASVPHKVSAVPFSGERGYALPCSIDRSSGQMALAPPPLVRGRWEPVLVRVPFRICKNPGAQSAGPRRQRMSLVTSRRCGQCGLGTSRASRCGALNPDPWRRGVGAVWRGLVRDGSPCCFDSPCQGRSIPCSRASLSIEGRIALAAAISASPSPSAPWRRRTRPRP